MKLQNKVAIVTGGARGLGRATAIEFVKQGAKVVVSALEPDEIADVVSELEALGGDVLGVTTDVRSKKEVEAMAAQAYARFGKVDILVNCAGASVHAPIAKIRQEDWDMVHDVNLRGTLFCVQSVFEQMCEQGFGHIINIASTAGKVGTALFGTYAASKFGVMGLTQSIDGEGFPHGVKAVAVCPGAADTKMRSDAHDDGESELLRPEDLAELILFIVTRPANAHIAEVMMTPQGTRIPHATYNLRPELLDKMKK